MLEWFTRLATGTALTYLVEAAFVSVDGFFPVVPGETVVITGAVLAVGGDLVIWLVLLAAFIGAVVGDNVSYLLGARVGQPAARRLFRGERSKRVLGWGRVQLRERGAVVIVVARFIPGGRTATTFSAGMLDMRWRTFLKADIPAAALWAGYATALGYFGGAAFRDSFWKPLAVSFALAGVIAMLGELARRIQTRRGGHRDADYLEEGERALTHG